jgi:ElaB/YqjD/DUF883 family membrane-anchored ribosome-binding protein
LVVLDASVTDRGPRATVELPGAGAPRVPCRLGPGTLKVISVDEEQKMGKRADRAKAKAEDTADETVTGLRSGAHTVVDGAEELLGKAKHKTKKARRHVDDIADKAEKKIASMRRKTDRKAKKIRKKAQKQIDKATKRL